MSASGSIGSPSGVDEIWSLIKGYDRFGKYNSEDYKKKWEYSSDLASDKRHIKYFKDFYDYMSGYDINGDGRVDSSDQNMVDKVFALHGISNGYTDSGRSRV